MFYLFYSDPKSYSVRSILNKYPSDGNDKLQKVSVESFYDHFRELNEAAPGNNFGDIDLEISQIIILSLIPQLLWTKS